MKILHLDDSPSDAFLVKRTLKRHGVDAQIDFVSCAEDFRRAVDRGGFDVVLLDSGVPGFDGRAAMSYVQQHRKDVPLIFCSGASHEQEVIDRVRDGATDFVLKDHPWQLVLSLRRIAALGSAGLARDDSAMQRLESVTQELSTALRTLDGELARLESAQLPMHSAREQVQHMGALTGNLLRLAKSGQ